MAKIVKIVEVLVDLQMRWQRVPFESGDFDENQEFGENVNMMKTRPSLNYKSNIMGDKLLLNFGAKFQR